MTTATREERFRHGRHLADIGVYLFLTASATAPWLPTPPRIVTALITTSVVAVLLVSMRHSRELCERCIAKVPLDPAAAVKRARPMLKTIHTFKRVVVPIAILLVAGMVLPQKSWESHLTSSLATLGCLALVVCGNRHRVLSPWCPFCHRGDGGSEASEVPDPSDGKRKPVPA